MTVEQRRDESSDQFPVGMRVLAVDDDLICLRVLESLLRKCQYHVTTTNQAVTALRLLRENKDKFDLVISDVHMPDMDGFKLLELVGLEMDLPVIMLSANGDTKLVMNGITHGACDYLLKPVRIEELKNIWQHVIRRKKLDSRDQSASNDQDKKSGEAGHGSIQNGNCDQDGKLNKKRKDQNDEDDEEHDESRHENEDPSTQKKPRVVWSVELHRKFVAAVNQLGLEKAVPKKILELMNVEKLTRENVASHLQKYRLYLKRISSVANQQANMVAALGGPDSPYLRMGSVNFHNFNGSSQFPPFHNNALRSFPPAGVFGRLNTPAGLGLHGLSPSGMGHGQVRNAVTDCAKFQPVILPGDQTGNVLQGMPTSLEFDNLQDNKKGFVGVGGNSSANDTSRIYPISNLTDPKSSIGGSSNPLLGLPHSSVVLQPQDNQSHDRFGLNSVPPSNLLDRDRCNSSWPSAVPAQTNSSSADCHRSRMLPDIRPRDESAPSALLDVSPSVRVHNQTRYSRMDTQCQAALLNELDVLDHMDFIDGSIGSTFALQSGCPSAHGADLRGATPLLQGFTGFGLVAKPGSDSLAAQHNVVPNSAMDTTVKAKQGHLMEQGRAFGGYAGVGAGSLEDIVSAVMKREQDGGINKAWRPVV